MGSVPPFGFEEEFGVESGSGYDLLSDEYATHMLNTIHVPILQAVEPTHQQAIGTPGQLPVPAAPAGE
jgi:hypothetical protein